MQSYDNADVNFVPQFSHIFSIEKFYSLLITDLYLYFRTASTPGQHPDVLFLTVRLRRVVEKALPLARSWLYTTTLVPFNHIQLNFFLFSNLLIRTFWNFFTPSSYSLGVAFWNSTYGNSIMFLVLILRVCCVVARALCLSEEVALYCRPHPIPCTSACFLLSGHALFPGMILFSNPLIGTIHGLFTPFYSRVICHSLCGFVLLESVFSCIFGD